MRGRNRPRYSEKLRLLSSSSAQPSGAVTAVPVDSPWKELKIKNKTAAKLRATPLAFFPVIGSPTKKKAKNMVKMGDRVPMMAVSMEVEIVIAFRKVSCGIKRPRADAATMRSRSGPLTCSRGAKGRRKRSNPQNSREAPMARRVNSTMGLTRAALAMSLQKTMFRPKMA